MDQMELQTSKTAPTSTPILPFTDPSKDANPFILDTDASGHAIGAALAQAGRAGREHVIQTAAPQDIPRSGKGTRSIEAWGGTLPSR